MVDEFVVAKLRSMFRDGATIEEMADAVCSLTGARTNYPFQFIRYLRRSFNIGIKDAKDVAMWRRYTKVKGGLSEKEIDDLIRPLILESWNDSGSESDSLTVENRSNGT